ncbi:hypothetical protein HHL22_19250 [Hymenobacter sp. RP-2-7]|uniref:Glycosyltransferase RgtA/B/C/D-like domain-containing protein n=1 Tax=Hymenobacter polaris TaxID=2682546 RepID=A0A7Y0AHF9_9BACT|nr:hypothetical protein [Hymenobacter polaris]NML67344.1 hypothetical protein [Hymenobacter polaris]
MPTPATAAGLRIRWEQGLFWLLLAAHLLPLWSHRYFLTSDGPAHLYNAWLLKAMLLHPGSAAHQLLAFNFNPEPNYLSHLLLGGLLTALPPWLADKLVLTLYVAGLPLALRYLLGALRPDASWLAVLSFPLIYSVVLLWGFYNFCLSIVILLWALGYWLRQVRPGRTLGSVAALAGLLTLLFLAHPLTYLVSGLLLGLLALAAGWQQRQVLRALGQLAVAYAPTLPLLGWYFWHKGAATAQPAQQYGENLWSWVRLEALHYSGSAEGTYRWLVALLLLAALVAATGQLWRGAAIRPVLPWLGALLLLLVAYVALPDEIAGGSIIRPRWGLLSYLVLLGGLGAVPWPRPLRVAGLGVGALVASLFLSFRWQKFEPYQLALADYRSALPHLRPGTSLLALTYADVTQLPGGPELDSYLPLFVHAAGYLGTEAQLLCYENYEAETGYFPLVWRPGRSPISEYGQYPTRLNPVLYQRAYRPTYVLLWGRAAAAATSPANAALVAAYLARYGYRQQFRSATGLLELYGQPGPRPRAQP